MKDVQVSDTRSFAIMGHTGSGKTTLVDAILLKLGLNDRLGSVDSSSSMADFTDEEKSRKTTISAKAFSAAYKFGGKSLDYVFSDTPGYMDFYGQVVAASRAAETGVVAVDASAGVQVGTRRVWKRCEKRNMARAIVITGLDKENTDFAATLDQIKSSFGSQCVPVVLPLPDGSGVVDVISGKDIPAELADQVEALKTELMELASETDDTLIEKFLGGEQLSPEETATGLQKAVKSGGLFPVFVTMSLKDIGVTELLDGVARLFPSPLDGVRKDKEEKEISAAADAPFVGLVWKTVNDAFAGQLAFVCVLGGTLSSDSEAYNPLKDQKERIGTLLQINGKKQDTVTSATAGDIVAIPKLKVTGVGDTLCAIGQKVVCKKVLFPSPVMFMSIAAKTQADEDKIGTALSRVCEEDQTLLVKRNTQTKETVIAGLGDVHIDVAVDRMKRRSNVEVVLSTPKVPYKETVTGVGEGHHKHKKQSGGRGQYGEVYLRVGPKKSEEEDWFINSIVGGVIPSNFIAAVQKGLVEGMDTGALAGFPITNIKATVYDGSYHDVDSSEIAFKIAASRALRDAMTKAKPVLLEPIMTVKVMIPDQYMGDINGDLNHKRGRILGMGAEDGMQVITAEVPQAELFRYSAELRSITAGQGSFEMEFNRYDVVPAQVAQKVIAATEKDKEEEK